MENIICHLCAGSPDVELYKIKLTENQKKYIGKNLNEINVDLCIGNEIRDLINNNVKTKGCCCGHGIEDAHVLVDNVEVDKLNSLGYEFERYYDTNMFKVKLKTDVQSELRKVLKESVWRYLENNN